MSAPSTRQGVVSPSGVLPWLDERSEAKHGYALYTNGCRCEVCRAAKAEYMRESRRRGREYAQSLTRSSTGRRPTRGTAFAPGAERALIDGIKHGRNGYEVHGCRCRDCTTAGVAGRHPSRNRLT